MASVVSVVYDPMSKGSVFLASASVLISISDMRERAREKTNPARYAAFNLIKYFKTFILYCLLLLLIRKRAEAVNSRSQEIKPWKNISDAIILTCLNKYRVYAL